MKILVVDDELDFLHAVKGVLEDEGYDVIAAGNGAQALERVKIEEPDLVLIDFMMPVMNGAEVFEALSALDGMKGVPVILMSAVQPGDAVMKHSWSGFLRKPFAIESLIDTVAKIGGPPGG